MPQLVSLARSQPQDHILKRIRAWKQRAKGQGRSSKFAYITCMWILRVCYDLLWSWVMPFFLLHMSIFSFISIQRNPCVPMRDILQPFAALTDPWNGLPADTTVQNWYKVLSTWPARSRHILLMKEYVFEHYCVIILIDIVHYIHVNGLPYLSWNDGSNRYLLRRLSSPTMTLILIVNLKQSRRGLYFS